MQNITIIFLALIINIITDLLVLHFRGILRRDSIWDWIVFGKIQKLLGGNVRLVFSASAPISERVAAFYQVAFGCYVS